MNVVYLFGLCLLINILTAEASLATTYYNGNQSINSYLSAGTHYMEDLTRTSTTVNCNYGDCSTGVTKNTDSDDMWIATNQYVANQVQWASSVVLDYFKTVKGRNGLDGVGGPATVLSENGATWLLANKIHYGVDPNYFAWTGSEFVFGDGDGTQYGPAGLDIVAHEMARAILEYSVTMNDTGESGALIESFGDVTAAVVSNWYYGENNGTYTYAEDSFTPLVAGDALRYLNEPHLAADKNFTYNDDPDYYGDMYTGTLDNGGVHVNCGIPNKVFYLLAKGGNHSHGGVTMQGLGIDTAYSIVYRAVTVYYAMYQPNTFANARVAFLKAATDLYGANSFGYQEVQTAWGLCGVGSIATPAPADVVSNSGFEGGNISPWNMSGNGCTYSYGGSHPKSGRGYMSLGVNNNYAGYVYQSFYIPKTAVSANLTFWTWITTSDSNTLIKDHLWIEIHNSTNQALINQVAGLSNLDASVSYVQKTYSLMSYVGVDSMQIRFYAINDNNAPTTFLIDEAYINVIYY